MNPIKLQKKIQSIRFAVFDFDGTMTDGFVYVDQDGHESVRCSRKDGFGIELLKDKGIKALIISKERNSVVRARCKKLGIECLQSVDNKAAVLKKMFGKWLSQVLYMGDDINDLECIKIVGLGVTVADGHHACKRAADYITSRRGGEHAVREVCDLVLLLQK